MLTERIGGLIASHKGLKVKKEYWIKERPFTGGQSIYILVAITNGVEKECPIWTFDPADNSKLIAKARESIDWLTKGLLKNGYSVETYE